MSLVIYSKTAFTELSFKVVKLSDARLHACSVQWNPRNQFLHHFYTYCYLAHVCPGVGQRNGIRDHARSFI